MQSKAKTVAQYLQELPEDRRATVEAVRKVILKNLPKGYEEGMTYGMIGYYVPHSLYPKGYHCDTKQPLPFGGLASQKNHLSLYLMCAYMSEGETDWMKEEFEKAGKKLDMGKSCIRFKKADDLALEVVGKAIAAWPVKRYVEVYERALEGRKK